MAEMDGRDVELIDYLRVLWRQKWVIIATLIAAIVAAWGASRAIAPTYQTETSLLLLPSLSSQLGAETAGSRLAPEAYSELVVSTSLLQLVQERVGLTEDIEELKKRFSVTVKRLSSDSGGAQFLLNATIKGTDRERLPETAAVWAAAFAEKFGELFQDRTARSYTYVSDNYDETEIELAELVEQRTALLTEHPISILQAELDALLAEGKENHRLLAAARLNYGTAIVQVAGLEEELSMQTLVYRLSRNVRPDSLVAALGAGLSTREIEVLSDLWVEDEQLNGTYINLDTTLATQRVAAKQFEEEILLREERAGGLRSELEAKQRELTEAQATLDELDRRIGILESALVKLATSLQDARLALAETPEPIRVIDEPLVPRYPIAPRKAMNIAIAGFLGLMIGTLLAFFVDYLARVREQEIATRLAAEAQLSGQPSAEHPNEDPERHRGGDSEEPRT